MRSFLLQDTVGGARHAAVELPAADINPAPEPSVSPPAMADSAAAASHHTTDEALRVGPTPIDDGAELAAPVAVESGDASLIGDSSRTAAPPGEEQGDAALHEHAANTAAQSAAAPPEPLQTYDSAGTDVFAREVVPAELLAPYRPLASAAHGEPAEAPDFVPNDTRNQQDTVSVLKHVMDTAEVGILDGAGHPAAAPARDAAAQSGPAQVRHRASLFSPYRAALTTIWLRHRGRPHEIITNQVVLRQDQPGKF